MGVVCTHSASPFENPLPFSVPGSVVVVRPTPTYSYAWWASTSSDLTFITWSDPGRDLKSRATEAELS